MRDEKFGVVSVGDVGLPETWSRSFLAPAGCCNLTRTHEVANVLLQKLVVVVKLVVFVSDGLDSTEYRQETLLEFLCVPMDAISQLEPEMTTMEHGAPLIENELTSSALPSPQGPLPQCLC
jgi:hypothetical protein